MIEPLQKGYKLNNQYTILDVVGVGGNSYVYLVEEPSVGILLVKEYIYGLGLKEYDGILRRLADGCIAGDASTTFIDWLSTNEKQAKKEQEKLRELRNSGFVFYEAALQSFQANNTYYTPILNSKGTILKDIEISNIQELYHYTLIILKAISNLHEKGYIHLDISPDNLLITPYDVGFLIDFGSAKSLENLDNDIMCKEEYAASEVLERIYYCDNIYFKNGDLGVWSDIYSIGKVMLYLEDKCTNKKEYQEELKIYHEAALKASNLKSHRRFQTIGQMQKVLEVEYEHMAYERWKNRETILNKAEALRKEFKSQIYSKESYYYKNRNHLFVGRKEELELISQFEKEDKTFSFITISAPAASGKSSLIYHYVSKNIDQSNYRYVYMDGKELGEYEPRDLVYLGFDLMLVVDYVSGYYKEIAEFLEKAKEVKGNNKLRVVFVERDHKDNEYPLWMDQLKPYTYHFNELISSNIYYKNIYLEALNKEEYEQIVTNEVYEKLVKIDTFKRPLYALMLSKMIEDQNVENITYIDVLDYIVSKEEKRIKEICRKENVDFEVWNQYYVLSTLCSYLDFDEIEINIPDSQLKNVITKINTNENGFILKGLEPDLIGEYYILRYFKNIRKRTIQKIMNEAWQINAKATSRTLIHMEDDFGQIYRKEYLNEEFLYYPYIINDEYHALLKQLSLNSEMKPRCAQILEKHYEFYIKDDVLLEYNGNKTVLNLPSVNKIGKLQGLNLNQVEEIIVSNQTTIISKQAFYYHPNLRKITLGENVTIIDDEAFKNCKQLKEVITNDKLELIGRLAFERTSLQSFDFPHTLKEIKYAAFSECDFKKIELSSSMTCIGSYAFSYNRSKIETVHYGCTLKKYGKHIFKESEIEAVSIDSLYVPAGLFQKARLKHVTLKNGLKEICENAFFKNELTEVVLPSSLEKIGLGAFGENPHLKNVFFNEGLKSIGSFAFQKTSLLHIQLPYTLEELGIGCFSGIERIESCIINGSMTNLEIELFFESSLQSLTINAAIETIGVRAFKETDIEKIAFPDTVKCIEAHAFEKCTKLRTIQFPKSLRKIKNDAFYGCESLNELSLNDQITFIGSSAFYGTSIKKVVLPPSVNLRAFQAFEKNVEVIYSSNEMKKMAELEKKRMWDSLNKLLSEPLLKSYYRKSRSSSKPPRLAAFSKDDTIEELILSEDTHNVGISWYSECKNLKKVVLNKKLRYLKSFAFSDCVKLSEINIPKSVITIQDYVFANTNINELKLPNHLYFLGCIGHLKIESLEIPRNTKLKSYWYENNYICINDNPNLKWISLYKNNFKYQPYSTEEKLPEFPHIFDNPKLEYVEVIFDEKVDNFEELNQFCEMHNYPFYFTNKSVILDAKENGVTQIYNDFIDNDYVFEKFKEWLN